MIQFERITRDTKAYMSKYKKIQKGYHKARNHFQNSVKLIDHQGNKISQALNCKGMRPHFVNALGHVCYDKFSTYNMAYVGWLMIISGVLLFLLSLVKIVDILTHSIEGGESLGFELGGL